MHPRFSRSFRKMTLAGNAGLRTTLDILRGTICAVIGLVFLGGSVCSAQLNDKISYNRDIRPILSNNCFFCHGFDENKRDSGLRLDVRDEAIDFGAIVPGDAESSELVARIFADDEDVMPPRDSIYQLTGQQKKLLKGWIEQGAEYEEHWSYRKLERPKVPQSQTQTIHPIDAFLNRKWKQEGVQPVPSSDPRTLIRRLSYDLRGLPPTADEVKKFCEDPSPAAYDNLVDQWTKSIEYAEHQGLLWLDLVRWADSSGMVSDEPIDTGRYRRFVIKSFRDNMPFDQFTREQLAGDLLPDRNTRTLVASGYNRLVKTNCEAGVIEGEAIHALKGEHVRALGTVWLGATTGCAECHDHKYDPISAKDYYSMAAFFDDLIEVGVYGPGDRRLPVHFVYDDKDLQQKDAELAVEIERLRNELFGQDVDAQAVKAWEGETLNAYRSKTDAMEDYVWMPAVLPAARVSSGEYQQTELGRTVTADTEQLMMHRVAEVLTGRVEKLLQKKKEQQLFFTDVSWKSDDRPQAIGIQIAHGAYDRIGWHTNYYATYFWGEAAHAKKFQRTLPKPDASRIVHLGPIPNLPKDDAPLRLEIPGTKLLNSPYAPVGMAWVQIGGTVTWGDSGVRLSGKNAMKAKLAQSTVLHWWELPVNRDDFENRMGLMVASLKMKTENRRPVHQNVINFGWMEGRKPELAAKIRARYADLYQLRQGAKDRALISKLAKQVRKTRLRPRGNFMDDSGPIVEPAIPEFLGTLDLDRRATRLDLANWLVAKNNPITPRVFVNRLWHQFYGRGLSETLEDSGNQGDWPSHPDLLDWLASEFVASGWDIRHMIQLMVKSQAYQLSSVAGNELINRDPGNRWHARQARFRLTAEEIRDSALQAAGLLKRTKIIPSRSFYPYQPAAYWAKSNKIMFGSRYQVWQTDRDDAQYQRSLYTFWKRQNPHPSMLSFDAPTRQECTAKRPTTNTPGQALALLNDPIFVEAARGLASQITTNIDSESKEERIQLLFQTVLQRHPSKEEGELLLNLLQEWKLQFDRDKQSAMKLLSVGQFKPGKKTSVSELAAWTSVCRLVLNLHEFITRS